MLQNPHPGGYVYIVDYFDGFSTRTNYYVIDRYRGQKYYGHYQVSSFAEIVRDILSLTKSPSGFEVYGPFNWGDEEETREAEAAHDAWVDQLVDYELEDRAGL